MGRWGEQIPEMPYSCGDPKCPCNDVRLSEETVSFQMGEFGSTAFVRDEDGMLIDVFKSRDLADLVRQVHESYPFARS
jgi:hypothetical protein